jgi:uncharacterized membrane protein YoaK (UPF0700 family)
MPKKKSKKRELKPKYYWLFQQLSNISFALSGFTVTALSVFLGFYSQNLAEASDIISVLLLCTVLFMLSGEMAREAYATWKYVTADTIYLFSLALLASSFLYFAYAKLPFIPAYVFLLIALPSLYIWYRAFRNLKIIYDVY